MKILTLVWSIGIGGTERAAVNYAIAYKLQGAESRVLVLGDGHDRKYELLEYNVPVILLKREAQPHLVFTKLQEWGPDIIHIHTYSPELIAYCRKVQNERTKVVETNVFSRPRFDESYREVTASLQLSEWGLWKYNRWMQGAAYKPITKVTPYIVMVDRFQKPDELAIAVFLSSNGIPPGAFVVGRIGQPHPSKWSPLLLRCMELTIRQNPHIYYLLVGVPDDLKKKLLQGSSRLQARIRCIDRLEGDKELSLYYYSLSAFAHISAIGESFGYVLAEAMACHIPVVSLLTPLKDNAQYEVVGHGVGGICVTNTAEFSNAITRLARDKKLYQSLKQNLVNWVGHRFSPEAVVSKLLQFFQDILESSAISQRENPDLLRQQFRVFGLRRYYLIPLLRLLNHPVSYKIRLRLQR